MTDYVSLLLKVAPIFREPVKLFTIYRLTLRCHLRHFAIVLQLCRIFAEC